MEDEHSDFRGDRGGSGYGVGARELRQQVLAELGARVDAVFQAHAGEWKCDEEESRVEQEKEPGGGV